MWDVPSCSAEIGERVEVWFVHPAPSSADFQIATVFPKFGRRVYSILFIKGRSWRGKLLQDHLKDLIR